ncbi:MAG: GNAT family N-acetyltransferase, partial [Ktedonobacteraceae bacterium]
MTDIQRNQAGEHEILLRGERVFLRRPTMEDAPRVFNWERDDDVWRYDPHRPYSHSMTEFLPIFE